MLLVMCASQNLLILRFLEKLYTDYNPPNRNVLNLAYRVFSILQIYSLCVGQL